MQSPFDSLDSALPRLRPGSALREHGWTILAGVLVAAAGLVLTADFTWGEFPRRQIGIASIEDFDVRARTRLFPLVLLASAATALALVWVLPRLQRRFGRELFAALDTTALAGVLLFFLYTFRQYSPGAWSLPPTFALLLVLLAALGRAGVVRGRATDLGRDAVWLGSLAFAAIALGSETPGGPPDVLLSDWGVPALVLGGALALALARAAASRRASPEAEARAHDRFVHAASLLAALPAAAVLHRELFLVLNNRGYTAVEPGETRLVVYGLLCAWIALRFVRGPRLAAGERLDVERVLGRTVLPFLVAGLAACGLWNAKIELSNDFFESGNAALSVQQWADFGKIPFVETFDAHGLSDSFFAFLERLVSGTARPTWQLWDFLYVVTASFATFHLLRVVLGSAAGAMFAWLCLPYMDQLFHPVPVHAVALPFALAWIVRRTDFRSWWAFGMLLAFAFAWRLDIGFASAIGTACVLPLVPFVFPGARLPWRTIALAALATAATSVLVVLAACAAAGVSFPGWLRDMAHITNSNQGFGFTRIARELTENVLWHLFVFPALLLAASLLLVARSRGRVQLGTRGAFVVLACLFLSAFTLANFPRGLVRHSFLENEMAMTSAFTLGVLAFVPAWLFPAERVRAAFTGFVVISALLAFHYPLSTPEGRSLKRSTTRYERSVLQVLHLPRLEASSAPIDRAPMSDDFDARHLRRMREFVDQQLAEDETFFDLSSSPLLYFHLRKPSPYWLNHLLLVYDDYMQERVLSGWKRWDTPVLFMPFGRELALDDGVQWWDELDSVEMRLRLYRIFERAYADFRPLAQVDRWTVWARKDWMQPAPPRGVDPVTEFSWEPGVGVARERAPDGGAATRVSIGGEPAVRVAAIDASWRTARYLRVEAESNAGGALDLAWATGDGRRYSNETRRLDWPAGARERYVLLQNHGGERALTQLSLSAASGVRLVRVELVSLTSREAFDASRRAAEPLTSQWGDLARLWGEHDPELQRDLPVLRSVYDHETSTEPSYAMGLEEVTDAAWDRGYARDRAAIRLRSADDAAAVRVGDHVLLGGGARRRAVRVEGREVVLDGTPVAPPEVDAGRILLHPERMSRLSVAAGESRSIPFEGLGRVGDHGRGQYVVLELAAHALRPGQTVALDYGLGQENLGRFVFETRADGEVHRYALRVTTQPNWALRGKEWISLSPSIGTIRLDSVRIVEAVE